MVVFSLSSSVVSSALGHKVRGSKEHHKEAKVHLSNGCVELGGLRHLILYPPRCTNGLLVARFELPDGTARQRDSEENVATQKASQSTGARDIQQSQVRRTGYEYSIKRGVNEIVSR